MLLIATYFVNDVPSWSLLLLCLHKWVGSPCHYCTSFLYFISCLVYTMVVTLIPSWFAVAITCDRTDHDSCHGLFYHTSKHRFTHPWDEWIYVWKYLTSILQGSLSSVRKLGWGNLSHAWYGTCMWCITICSVFLPVSLVIWQLPRGEGLQPRVRPTALFLMTPMIPRNHWSLLTL